MSHLNMVVKYHLVTNISKSCLMHLYLPNKYTRKSVLLLSIKFQRWTAIAMYIWNKKSFQLEEINDRMENPSSFSLSFCFFPNFLCIKYAVSLRDFTRTLLILDYYQTYISSFYILTVSCKFRKLEKLF